jgi:BirA family biotin operon repressor/biotin-[acetyl-CoA-carboxylase] ligase
LYEHLPEILRTRCVGRVIRELDSVDSTNTAARLLPEEGSVPDGTVIIAREQSAGRGRVGHGWHSPRDAGLYLSVILRPPPGSSMELSSLAVGAAAAQTLRRHYGLPALIKWPNDVLINGRKVCGVLVERIKTDVYILGVGLNTNWTSQIRDEMESAMKKTAPDSGVLYIPPGALSLALGGNVDHAILLGRLLESIDVAYTAILRKFYGFILRRVQRNLFGVGRAVIIGQDTCGVFAGINNDGHALVRREDGTVLPVQSGEVHFADRD